jgi:hypothetical protein
MPLPACVWQLPSLKKVLPWLTLTGALHSQALVPSGSFSISTGWVGLGTCEVLTNGYAGLPSHHFHEQIVCAFPELYVTPTLERSIHPCANQRATL